MCAAVACLNGVCWSIISPPFQVPDESAHYAYVQHLAETGSPPTTSGENFGPAEEYALNDLHNAEVLEHPSVGTISTSAQQHKLERDLVRHNRRTASGDAGVATSQPPLYYALESVPYGLESGGTVLDRLELMRLLSALLGGLTALFGYLFLREALPATPWAWTVGGLAIALAPLLGTMSGAVNPDVMLFAVSAALFYCLARGFRRGLEPRLAAAIGAVIATGLLTKLTFLGLLPGAILGLLALCAREARTSAQRASRCLALGLGVGASPVLLYAMVNLLSGRSTAASVGSTISLLSNGKSIGRELSYIWQFYLPRLPGMHPDFHGILTTRVYWYDGMVGIYGWVDTAFPRWVYTAALLPTGVIAVLLARALFVCRAALRSRLVEVLVYLAMTLGVLFIIGASDYLADLPGEYAEPRYALSMLVLWGAVVALAARGAGRRWGPVAGVLLVTLLLAHNLFSQLLVISRYYG